ncbi:MerR family DNA-binding transcriptional regulator, partial [Poseidonibacter lekithochrous]
MYLIGQLAKLCNVSSDTLRFYEKNQLIVPAGRSESGYRLYSEDNLSR